MANKDNIKTPDLITCYSGFGHNTKRGFVELVWGDRRLQMPVSSVKELAMNLLQAAEAAETDHALWILMTELVEDDQDGAMRMHELPRPKPIGFGGGFLGHHPQVKGTRTARV